MICVSLAESNLNDFLVSLRGVDFAEIRLDRADLTVAEVTQLFSVHPKLVATCRPGPFPDGHRKGLLLAAIDAGAVYVDIELESERTFREEIIAGARSRRCTIIISFHDYEKTPGREMLEATLAECFRAGADVAKIACMARSERDAARLLGLLDTNKKVVTVAMGTKGRIARIAAPLLGSPFTFASLQRGKETADGQIDRVTLVELIRVLGGRGEEEVPS
jgi:3-dehydroquinate dehydratase-1